MNKLIYFSFILFSSICFSCTSNTSKAFPVEKIDSVVLLTDSIISETTIRKDIQDDPYKEMTSTEIMSAEEQISFWKEFKKNLLKKDYQKLADMVQYPLFGDVFRFKVYAPDYTDEQVALANSKDGKFYREDFIENASKIFDKEFIQLLVKYDFDKAIKDKAYNPTLKTSDGYIHSIHLFTGEEYQGEYISNYHLSYNSGDPRESITEFSEIYYIRKNKEGKILLYCINGAG
ncbi:MAG: hypothetical protein ACK5KL_02085 [Dysgonomonas sp.]